jgi:tetratricopeptide (TPR) repeat protein
MLSGDAARSPRHLVALFLGTTFVLLTALGWIGWQALQQDRRVEAQLVRDRLESATDLIASQIRQNLTDTEEQLSLLAAVPPESLQSVATEYAARLGDDALLVVFDATRVTAYPAGRLLYYPTLPDVPDAPTELFAYGDALEFKDRDYRSAIAFFEKLARSDDGPTRAGALLRLARNQRKAGQLKLALDTYAELATMSGAFLGGWPADLRARKTRCDLLEQLGLQVDLKAEAEKIDRDLHSGRWRLPRSTFLYLTGESRRWLDGGSSADRTTTPPTATNDGRNVALALAANVDSLWERWQRDPAALSMLSSRRASARYRCCGGAPPIASWRWCRAQGFSIITSSRRCATCSIAITSASCSRMSKDRRCSRSRWRE